jgi:hypothetical protein
MHHRYTEPNLEEALSEDLVRAMMNADHVDPTWLRGFLAAITRKQRLVDRPTVTGGSCSRFQGGALAASLPRRRCRPFR